MLADYLAAMRGSGDATILAFFGNGGFHPLELLLDDVAAKGLRAVSAKGSTFYAAQGRLVKRRDETSRGDIGCAPDAACRACAKDEGEPSRTIKVEA